MTVQDVQLIDLPKILDPRGNLSFIQEFEQVPFKIERTYWIYDVPGGEIRGGHAFTLQQEFVVALSGSFDVIIHDGKEKKRFHLNRSYFGLFIPNGLWREMDNFSTNSVVMILSSTGYDPSDYTRDYTDFLKMQSDEE
jgi:dTDP-4-dehydrorhamnose 3,5-epimerase-like enzyme